MSILVTVLSGFFLGFLVFSRYVRQSLLPEPLRNLRFRNLIFAAAHSFPTMQYLVFIAAVSGAALAENLLVAAPQRLHARQDLSFTPPTTLTTSCRSGEIICPVRYRGRGYCAAPALGDVCCAQGCKYLPGSPDVSRGRLGSRLNAKTTTEMSMRSLTQI